MNKEKHELEKAVEAALLSAGFVRVKRDKFIKGIGQETEIFVYPQVRSKGSLLELQPIVGFENTLLRARLQEQGKKDTDLRVGYVYLGTIRGVSELWNGNFSLWIPKGRPIAPAVDLFMAALENIAVKKFMAYDSVERVISLIKLYIEGPEKAEVIIMDAKEKLAILATH